MGYRKPEVGSAYGIANPSPGRDTNSGGGYGRLRGTGRSPADGSGEPRPSQDHFPYLDPINDFSQEEAEVFFDDILGDEIDQFVAMVNGEYQVSDPSNRQDRASLVTNQLYEYISIVQESLPRARRGISPFSHRTLFPRGFSGPALGGFSASQANTTRPGKRGGSGSKKGWSKSPPPQTNDPANQSIASFSDIIDKNTGDLSDLENVMKHRRRIQKILGEIDEQL